MSHRSTAPAAPGAQYRSLSGFYLADSRRVHSREVDVGLWWREGDDGPLHRAAWVRDTGELYLVRLGPGGGAVELLASVADEEQLTQALAGWRDACGTPDSLTWLRRRASRLGDRVRRAQVKLAAAGGAAVALASLPALAGAVG